MTDIKNEMATSESEIETLDPSQSEAQHIEQANGSVKLYSSTGNVRLIPVPTDDARDPLTWPRWKRLLIIATLAVYGTAGFGGVQSAPLYFPLLIAKYMQQTRGMFNPASIADLASYPSLCMGIGNFVFVPLSLAVGRRPIFLLCNVLMIAANIWAALSDNFNSDLGSRCLQGLASGISDCLLPLIVLDITFLHRRGLYMGLYWAITAIGASLLLVAAPFIVHHASDNWRVNYWFWFAFSCAALLLAIFFLPETLYPREPAMLEGKVIATDAYGHVRVFDDIDAAEKAGLKLGPKQDKLETTTKQKPTFVASLGLFHRLSNKPIHTFLQAYLDMLVSLLTPSVFWTLLLNSVLFGGLVALSLTYSQVLESPPWLFSNASVGTVQLGAALGAALSFLLTSTTTDRLSALLTRRYGKGVHEPEYLLPSFVLPVLLSFAGLTVYGVVAGNPERHAWVGMHAAFALYYCGFVALSAVTSVWVAEIAPQRAGPAIVLVCGGRNAVSFGISHSFTPWIAAAGFQNAHITLGCLLVGLALFGVPLFFVNKKLRMMYSRINGV